MKDKVSRATQREHDKMETRLWLMTAFIEADLPYQMF